ncbi:MAG TPA: N-acetylneuraminate synthase family protein [Candidatus Gastranaerophilaceae bacterium]|nr:N-acetylneuraminate synthase family protein [Candidatus Gastranaerophilaceae bacterium]HPT41420.1 N-acetylneuraminate synthase family protein [Candidatus Gastranaerophilaceae bacterium]
MRKTVKIADKIIGDGHPCFVIAEIGINHNGDVNLAKKLIDVAVMSGCDAVKFQKRTVDVVYTKEELAKERQSPFGETNGDLKRGLEFGYEQYSEISKYCKKKGIIWFASCWDEESVDFIEKFNPPCYKISSASLTDDALLKHTKSKKKPILLSTGMSTMEQIEHAVQVLGSDNLVIYHCTSTYPSDHEEINLKVIKTFREKFDCPIGFSGHERGLTPSIVAVAMGANSVERHITMDRTLWGSDHAASLEPNGLFRMVRDIRQVPIMTGDGVKKVYESELPIIKKLRRK